MYLAQFDGSCHGAGTDQAAAGCGVVIWRVVGANTTLEEREAFPLVDAKTAPASEAMGAAKAIMLMEKVISKFNEPHTAIIQGDNKAIINHWQGTAVIRQLELHQMLAEAHKINCTQAITCCL